MNAKRAFLLIAVSAVAAVSFHAPAFADVIFDNTAAGDQGITTTAAPQLGLAVTAAGSARAVTEVDIAFTSQGVSATADLQAFLYATGAGGLPGALLWQSAVMSSVAINSVNQLIAFSVPSIVVPDFFTITAAITDISGSVGLAPTSSASVGTFDQAVVGSPATWNALPTNFEIQARVIASPASQVSGVPEPMTLSLFGAGLAAGAALRRRKSPKA
jgi:hypothetical protein